jgi:iron complex outermembrane receptor protein
LLSAAQNDVCLNSSSCAGQDVAATAGFGVVDLYMKREVNQSVALSMGVDNLFDKLYRHHESRDNVFDPSPIQVNEPGRTVWLSVSGHF